MDLILYLLIFAMGTVFGSFFTLAVYRIPLKQDITHERSYCPNCSHKLGFWDMIPLFSYLFLKGKCHYCKQKIRPRYFLLELLSGIVFVLFAMSIKLSLWNIQVSSAVYFGFGLLYFATLFIIAGIDKEKIKIEKPVLLFGYIVEIIYIVYLYIVEKDPNIYRYVIYLAIICILLILDTIILRKKIKNSYPIEVLLLAILMITFTYEYVFALTVCCTLLAIAFTIIIHKIVQKRKQYKKKLKEENTKLPIGFYLCISNVICLIISNFVIFYSYTN